MGKLSSLVAAILLVGSAAAAGEDVVVVELFTSEGCSSCPPADRVLARLAAEAGDGAGDIVAIGYHVDYWDRLGWPDRFADAAYSSLQRSYATQLGQRRVFTPQAVVNGRISVVGSDERAVREAIDRTRSDPSTLELDLVVLGRNDRGKIEVSLSAKGAGAPVVVRLVAIETGLVTSVRSGENSGRTLRHENVARGLTTIEAGPKPRVVAVKLPDDAVPENVSIAALAQDPDTLEILGATVRPLAAGNAGP